MKCLIDCNNFFASCEQVFDPKLRNKPLVILSSNDGCVIARSKEAKALNIPMGAPAFKYDAIFKKHHVVMRSSNFALYGDMSHRVMNIIESEGFPTEIYSIDEAFLDLPFQKLKDLEAFAKSLKEKLYKWTGITVSIGIAPTKTLAKVANKLSKGNAALGYTVIEKDKIDSFLKNFPVSSLWGVGRSYKNMLQSYGITTALKLIKQPDEWIRKKLSVHGLKMVLELKGTPTIHLEDIRVTRKSLVSSRSFGTKITSLSELKQAVSYFCSIGCEKLRKEKLRCSFLCIYVATSRFKENYIARSSHITLPYPTQSTITITKQALKCLNEIYVENAEYKKAGIMLGDFSSDKLYQNDLFNEESSSDAKLMHVVDHINNKYGRKTLYLASEGHVKKWQPKQSIKSNLYTTSWKELLTIKLPS